MAFVNVGLNRRKPRKPGARTSYEYKNVQGIAFDGAWGDDAAHRAFRDKMATDYPGWSITGYCLVEG